MGDSTGYDFTRKNFWTGEDEGCYIEVDEEAREQEYVGSSTGWLTFTSTVTEAILENAPDLSDELADTLSAGPALQDDELVISFEDLDVVNLWFVRLAARLYKESEEGNGEELDITPHCACVDIPITDDDIVCLVDFLERLLVSVSEARETNKNTLTNRLVGIQLVHDDDTPWNEWWDVATNTVVDMTWLEGIAHFLGMYVAGLVPEGSIAWYESEHDQDWDEDED